MDFDIYTLGDGQIYWDILNGIAMLFSGSGIVSGSNGMNLGYGALLGAMMLLTIMVYRAVFERRLDFKMLVMPLVVYVVLTVPKVDMVVNDIYNTEPPKRVDNVPMGLALTASTLSGFTYILTLGLEQALSIIPADSEVSYLPRVTEEGFLTPLQILNQIRYDDMNMAHPSFQRSFNSLYQECIVGNPQYSAEAYRTSQNPFNYMMSTAESGNGMVVIQKTQGDELVAQPMNCAMAADSLRASFGAYMSGEQDLLGIVNTSVGNNAFKDRLLKRLSTDNNYGKVNSVNGLNHYSQQQIADLVANTLAISADRGRNFMSMIVFDPLVRTANVCSEQFNTFNMSMCTGWVTAAEQWKTTAALSGNSFLKNIRNGQNILILVGFMLFPIVVFMIMMQGLSSVKIVAGYIIFLFTNFLWLPMATIINFYTQYKIQEYLHLLRLDESGASLTLAQSSQFYDALTDQLAIANQMLGMIPILTMVLFGGGLMAMRSFTQATNVADTGGYNEKINSKTIKESAPLSESSSMIKRDGYGPTQVQGIGTVEYKIDQAVTAAKTSVASITEQQNYVLGRLSQIADRASEGTTVSHKDSSGNVSGEGSGTSIQHERMSGNTSGQSVLDGTTKTGTGVIKEDVITVGEGRSASNNYIASGDINAQGGGTVEQPKGLSFGAIKEAIKGTKTRANASVGGAAGPAAVDAANITVERSKIDDDTRTPTEKAVGEKLDILRLTKSDVDQVSGKEATYNVQNSGSYNFRAEALNEAIQRDRSGLISASEKEEASQLLEKMRSLTYHKAQVYSTVLSNSVSDRDLVGMMNKYSPRSNEIITKIDNLDELGSKNVRNWDELKAMGERNAMLGGHSDQDNIRRVAIFFAATHSNNSEVTMGAINAVSRIGVGANDEFNQNKGMFTVGAEVDRHKQDAQKKLNENPVDVSALKQKDMDLNMLASAIGYAKGKTDAAKDLSTQDVDLPVNKVIVEDKQLDYEALRQKIEEDHEKDKVRTLYKPLVYQNPKIGAVDEAGNLKVPVIEDTVDGKVIKRTEADREIEEANKAGNQAKVIEALTLKNDKLSGVYAEKEAESMRQRILDDKINEELQQLKNKK
jgi:conjugal transfer mating pair stabilization protein TraG